MNKENINESKIEHSYKNIDKPKKKKRRRSIISIILIILCVCIVISAIIGINLLVKIKKYKPYKKYEEKIKVYGFDKAYNNQSGKTGDSIKKSEAIKMVLACVLNTNDISGMSKKINDDINYDNASWVEYAKGMELITDSDINKDNYNDKATYIEVIRYFAAAKVKLLGKELDSAVQLKVKDIEKYKSDEQVAIEDMIQNEIIQLNSDKIRGSKNIFKGQMNELIVNFAEKYNTITLNGEKININENKMPSNKDEYPYTLASVDRIVYEKAFSSSSDKNFQNPKELYNVKKEYYTQIQEIAEGYYNLILNVDYNTINYDDFRENLLGYLLYGTEGLKDYVNYVKDNKIIIVGKSNVVFPAIYFDGIQYVVRMKLEFEIKSSDTKNNLLYMDPIDDTDTPVKYENNKYVVYIDTKMGNALNGSTALYNNNDTVYNLLLEGQKEIMSREKVAN